MKSLFELRTAKKIIICSVILFTSFGIVEAQYNIYRFTVTVSPIISWFNTDVSDVRNVGSRAGFNFNITAEKSMRPNCSFTTGIAITNAGGRLRSDGTTYFEFENYTSVIEPGNAVIYRIQYLSVPVGFKLTTPETGRISYFIDPGLDPKIVVRGRVDIPSLDIYGQRAVKEIRRLNFGYHMNGGVNYSLDGMTSLVLGIGFENSILDVTKETGNEEKDRTTNSYLKFIFGVNF